MLDLVIFAVSLVTRLTCNKAKITIIRRQFGLDIHIVVASSQDPAGVTMADYLKGCAGFASDGKSTRHKNVLLHIAPGSLLTLENLDEAHINATSFIFLSKHRSGSHI